ncbi:MULTISPECIES: YggT family protein [Bacillaceae]|uniref:YggT family protein n=1 Tax=Peribacillus huizhouensis TaxID=1501239 RepID=A0ABR6CIY8_9BACI|nr:MULTISPECIES: YggT family protein [Bacillaceae]MBA9024947.1 YggT family protein [Peribacillus huizhouensis]
MTMLVGIILTVIKFYSYALVAYILMSWFPNARETSIGQFLARISEPYLEPFRRFVPPLGMIDFSPIVAILALQFAGYGISQIFLWI